MVELLADVQTNKGKDVAKVYRTPSEEYHYEIRTPSETDRIHIDMKETKEAIRSNVEEFLESIDHPDADTNLFVNMA
ncbi:hypothetical protein [Natronoarchaeum philippinense]|uniref:hypothetical protein n=1 Tax=Natronoarchaeum philippinense TaxID=558529 RepID=UPI00117BF973|nr:hypothetical protein [Natronoarchaeum philippinense]